MTEKNIMWYEKPATCWEEALPVGNGRLGAMVMGGVSREVIYLNEDSIWSGKPVNRINKDAKKYLEDIRKLIREGRIPEAEKLSLMALSGTPNSERSYETAGELIIEFENGGDYTNYKRQLVMEEGTVSVSYECGAAKYKREFISSFPDQVMAYHFTAEGAKMGFTCRLDRCHNRLDEVWADGDEIGFKVESGTGIPFAVRVKAQTKDGEVKTIGEHLIVKDASEVTLFIDIRTGFYDMGMDEATKLYSETNGELKAEEGFLPGSDYLQKGVKNLDAVASKGWSNIFADHKEDFGRKFSTLSLRFGEDPAAGNDCFDAEMAENEAHIKEGIGGTIQRQNESENCNSRATDKRLQALKNGEKDPQLFALYFQYGRYLLLSSSRGRCLPANLQGIWNNSMTPPWDSKFTININAEMNYWMAESGNLSECHMPYFDLLRRVCENGKETAQKMYGCRGSVAHHNTDIYADTAPQDHYIPASFWVMGEAWMATHIWEHYLFTGDRDFLEKNFDVLDECVDFFEDFLIEGENGELVTSPSVSPENVYIMEDGTRGCLCEGATMDVEILMELLGGYIKACEILGGYNRICEVPVEQDATHEIEDECESAKNSYFVKAKRAQSILERLPSIKIGKHGQIQEWMKDYDELEPGHRHISHLYGVYPGSSISYEKTPELMKAARVTLERRLANGGGHTGWSRAWIIGLWAHFLDGEKVYENLHALLCKSTFDNLMDNHPYGAGAVFQIDGNLGASAAILEMLVQCRDGYVKLLPALPEEFSEGCVSGVCLRGGYELSMEWKDMKVTKWEIKKKNCDNYGTDKCDAKDSVIGGNVVAGDAETENSMAGEVKTGNVVAGDAVTENAVAGDVKTCNAVAEKAVVGDAVAMNAVAGDAMADCTQEITVCVNGEDKIIKL